MKMAALADGPSLNASTPQSGVRSRTDIELTPVTTTVGEPLPSNASTPPSSVRAPKRVEQVRPEAPVDKPTAPSSSTSPSVRSWVELGQAEMPALRVPVASPLPSDLLGTGDDHAYMAILEAHNRRIGSRLQRFLQQTLVVYLAGPFLFLLVRILARPRTYGLERLDRIQNGHMIFAIRHFFEWDPILCFYVALWRRALRFPHIVGHPVVGRFWTKSRLRRAVSWLCGLLGLARGAGPGQSAFTRAKTLLERKVPTVVHVFPTGPIGRRTTWEMGRAAGYVALAAPHVPIVPVTLIGVQEMTWKDVLLLRRPRVTVVIDEPFRGSDIPGDNNRVRVVAITERIRQSWERAEAAVARGGAA